MLVVVIVLVIVVLRKDISGVGVLFGCLVIIEKFMEWLLMCGGVLVFRWLICSGSLCR